MKRLLLAAVAALALAGCSSTPSVQEVSDAAGKGAVALMKEANGSTGAMTGSSTMVALRQLTDTANQTGLMPSLRMLPSRVTDAASQTYPARLMGGTSLPTTSGVDARADALGTFLRTRIFTDANVESRGSDGLVFRITGDDVCGDGVNPPDPACVSSFDRFEVRIRVNHGVEGLNFFLELGPKRDEPLVFVLGDNLIGIGTDLAAVKSSLEYLDQASGQPVYVPKTMEGQFMVKLKKNGDQDFTLTSSVSKAIKVEVDGDMGPASFSTEAKDPWLSLHINAKAKQIQATLDVGATDLSFPYSPNLSATGNAGKELSLHLAGASMNFDLSAAALSFKVENIGLGDGESYLALDGTHLLTVNLNPNSGRHFSVTLAIANQTVALKIDPEFDLTTDFFYKPLQADTDVTIPPYAVDSSYQFQFNGDSPAFTPTGSGFKVTSGTLRLVNKAQPDQAVVVNAGQCLVSVTPATGADPLIGGYAAQACP